MAEEHRCQAPHLSAPLRQQLRLLRMPCQQRSLLQMLPRLQLKEQQSSSAKLVLNQTLVPPPSPVVRQPLSSSSSSSSSSLIEPVDDPCLSSTTEEKAQPNGCGMCRWRVHSFIFTHRLLRQKANAAAHCLVGMARS